MPTKTSAVPALLKPKAAAKKKPQPAIEDAVILDEIANDAAADIVDASAVLQRITAMVNAMAEADRDVEEAEAELKRVKARYDRIAREDLPSLMQEAQMTEVKLENGVKVTVVPEIACGISEARREEAHEWLRKDGSGALIKNNVTVSFSASEDKKADSLVVQMVKKFGMDNVQRKEAVHPATLKSFLKGLMSKKKKFPLDLFGVIPYDIAKVTQPKKVKGI